MNIERNEWPEQDESKNPVSFEDGYMNIERNEAEEYGGNGEHATLYATNSSQSIAAATYAAIENAIAAKAVQPLAALEAAAPQRGAVRDLPSFKREEKPLNTGHNHVCASRELGEFVSHKVYNAAAENEPANWCVQFNYQHGYVLAHVEQNNYRYARALTD